MSLGKISVVGAFGLSALVAIAVPSFGQVSVSVVTKSGQRQTGNNLAYRIDRREVIVRTSPSEEPRVPVDQVAYIDFGGTPDVDPRLSGSQEAVVLRSGTVLKGQVIELGHGTPGDQKSAYLVIFRTEGGEERRLNSNEVARVYFAGSSAAATAAPAATATTATTGQVSGLMVPAKQAWTPTGVTVRRNEWITFRTSGEVNIGGGTPVAGVAGASGQTAPGAPVQAAPAGALIGRIGNGAPFLIGNQGRVRMTEQGQLSLGINDGHLDDNEGMFQVAVEREAGTVRR